MEAQSFAAILAALGAGTILRDITSFAIKWWTGRSSREAEAANKLLTERDRARRERDAADEKRRQAQEDNARYRRALIRAGVDPDEVRDNLQR